MNQETDIQRLNKNIDDLFDKRDQLVKEINSVESDMKLHIGEDKGVHAQHSKSIDDLEVRIKVIEKFQATQEGKEAGKGWVQKYSSWLISLVLFLLLMIDKIVAWIGGIIENSGP